MTFPVIADISSDNSPSAGSPWATTNPSSVQVGDLLVLLWNSTQTAANPTFSAGWTVAFGPNGNTDYAVVYRIADGTANDVCTVTYSASGWIYQILRITGSTGLIEATAVGANSSTPDPPSLNPSTWDVEDTLWLASCGIRHQSGAAASFTDDPDGFTLLLDNGNVSTTATGGRLRTVTLDSRVASVDPSTFSLSVAKNNTAVIVAIRPAAVPDVVPNNLRMIL